MGEIEGGMLVLAGFIHGDTAATAVRMAAKVAELRIFEDARSKMNLSLAEVAGSVLCVSQFTLYGDARRGRRPSFDQAAPPEVAEPLYRALCESIEALGVACARGIFGAEMRVSLVNEGPFTLLLDSASFDTPRRA